MSSEYNKWKFVHLGFVVKDIDKSIELYQSLGLGPFTPLDRAAPATRRVYMGKEYPPDAFGFSVRMGKVGPTMAELVQPVKGNTMQQQFLDEKGEGINHIAFEVEDISKAQAYMEAVGYEVVQVSEFANGEICLFFDNTKEPGLTVELIQPGKTAG